MSHTPARRICNGRLTSRSSRSTGVREHTSQPMSVRGTPKVSGNLAMVRDIRGRTATLLWRGRQARYPERDPTPKTLSGEAPSFSPDHNPLSTMLVWISMAGLYANRR